MLLRTSSAAACYLVKPRPPRLVYLAVLLTRPPLLASDWVVSGPLVVTRWSQEGNVCLFSCFYFFFLILDVLFLGRNFGINIMIQQLHQLRLCSRHLSPVFTRCFLHHNLSHIIIIHRLTHQELVEITLEVNHVKKNSKKKNKKRCSPSSLLLQGAPLSLLPDCSSIILLNFPHFYFSF